ncbi:MAG: BMC domain-containing protein [Clostridia bacterium]|nr:BMC domain-containing protein [Clostridia bacterium]MBQ3553700.1 BMC domain-containing protein [Clostridia bacterium]
MQALGMIEVYSFSTALRVADIAAKTADVRIIAFDRNRPIRTDVPAPLVMVVKMEGAVAAVKAAVEAGVSYAKECGKYIVSHIIANPGDGVEKMAYLLDINKDKFNKKLPKSLLGLELEEKAANGAIGFIEVEGLVATIEGTDAMLKAADVRLVHTEKRLGGRLVTIIVVGTVSAVEAAVAAGVAASSVLGKIYGREVIANPHPEVTKFFDMDTPNQQ